MPPSRSPSPPALSLLPFFASLYGLASLAHFFHNAEYCGDYPNLPAWISRGSVYATWIGITTLGAAGFFLLRRRQAIAGLVLIALYGAMGFDGLGHYSLAPIGAHSRAMNLTIWSEVLAGALLLAVTLRRLLTEWRVARVAANASPHN